MLTKVEVLELAKELRIRLCNINVRGAEAIDTTIARMITEFLQARTDVHVEE